jgi:hypothetical protein
MSENVKDEATEDLESRVNGKHVYRQQAGTSLNERVWLLTSESVVRNLRHHAFVGKAPQERSGREYFRSWKF